MATTLATAIKAWEAKHGKKADEAKEIKLCCQIPPIAKMDAKALVPLKDCEHLSVSTNSIDRLASLAGMKSLRVLSIGRNNLKKLEKLDEVATTLEQLWMSYNQVTSLEVLTCLTNLEVLYCSNNCIKSFSDLDHLASLPKLRDVLFVGNPCYECHAKAEARLRVLQHLPQVTKIDGEMVKPAEIDEALKLGNAA